MKKILISLICLLVMVVCRAQTYPVPINVANAPSQIGMNNAFKGKLIVSGFADTTAANTEGYLKNYDGALIKTTTPINAIWYRYLAGQQWVQILPSGGSTGTLAWVMGGNNPVVSDGSGNAILGPQTNNGIAFMSNNTQRVILPASGLTFNQLVSDTTANKVMTFNPSTKDWGYGYWYGGGSGATPTWQQTLTAGSTLTGLNSVNGGGFEFDLLNTSILQLGASGASSYLNLARNDGTGDKSSTVILRDSVLVEATSNSTSRSSSISVYPDMAVIKPSVGVLIIDTLTNLSTQDEILGRKNSTGQVGYITIGSGLSLSNGALSSTGSANTALSNLASVAINTSLLPGTDNSIDIGSGAKQFRYGIFGTGGISIGAAAAPSIGRLQVETSGAAGGGITLRNTTAGAYSTMDFYNDGGFNGQFLITGSTYSNGFFNGNQLAFANYAASGNVAFLASSASGYLKFGVGGFLDANEMMRVTTTGLGVGDASPASLFTVGSGDLFQVNTSGDLVKLKNVTYSWPAANAAGVLTNNGSGTLSWAASSALTNGVGTTANGTAVDLGGTVNSNVAIDEDGGNDISFDIGRNTAFSDIRLGALNFTLNGGPVQMNNYGAGAATFDASGNITSVSDMRLKNLQGMYGVGLKQLMQINPIVYKYNAKSKLDTVHNYIGFSAQNVKGALGENAVGVNKDGYYSLQDRAIMAAMVNSIKELKELNDNQQEQIKELRADIKKLKKQ